MGNIIIQGAAITEIDYLESKLLEPEKIVIGGFEFTKGKFDEKNIVISRTKVGEINAASATTIAILKFSPEIIINQGTAGGHGINVHKGDLVIGESCVQMNSYKTPKMLSNEGYNIENWDIREFISDEDKGKSKTNFANQKLIDIAKRELPKITNMKIHTGVIGSGDVWNRETDRIMYLNKNYNTLCEEMETSAVYKIANSFRVPAISIRIISNNEILEEEYDRKIATECQKVIYDFVKKL